MDPRTLLEHALFQLTPTRTRCDLVIFANGVGEKLASGLLEPFLCHLKSAKDQISRGGYSITLRPVANNSYWFTKATLQRFVRFVSSPEVLERFVTIETELQQIASSVQVNEQSNADAGDATGNLQKSSASLKPTGDYTDRGNEVVQEESKVHLQRALVTRKAVLRKEQAMAYARALVAGFELESINDLILFADAFGASRLRQACINFVELCKKKSQDRLWIDEIAAMQAARVEIPDMGTSGITLAGEESYSNLPAASLSESMMSIGSSELNQDGNVAQMQSTDGKSQVPLAWPNHYMPNHYMHNFQGAGFQHMPPYQGYHFPGMPMASPYFPGNMQWPPNLDDSNLGHEWEPPNQRKHKSSSRKKKSSHVKEEEASDQENSSEPSDSGSETESDELQNGRKQSSEEQGRKKKHGKKSSRKVVIRNINYITSRKDGGKGSMSEETSDEEFIDGEALKQQVEAAVGSLDWRHKSTPRHHKKSQHKSNSGSNASDQEQKVVASSNFTQGKGGDHWGAFQSLLMKDKDVESLEIEPRSLQVEDAYSATKISGESRASALNLESEEVRKQRAISNDSFVATKREASDEGRTHIENFEGVGNVQPGMKRRDSTYEELMFSERSTELGNHQLVSASDYSAESPVIKSQKEGDWFIGKQDKSLNMDESMDVKMFAGDYASSLTNTSLNIGKNKKEVIVDDSFMIQARPFTDNQSESLSRTDIVSMALDMVEATHENESPEIPHDNAASEPDDLYMVLGRDSAADGNISSWSPEINYEMDMFSAEANGTHSVGANTTDNDKGVEGNASGSPDGKGSGKELRSKVQNGSLGKSKSDVMSRTKKPPPGSRYTGPKSKYDREEENRKRMEELRIQRQKRIAERSAVGSSSTAIKRVPPWNTSMKNEKPSPSLENKKPVFRSSTIDRLATARITPTAASGQSKPSPAQKATSKANGIAQKTVGGDKKKPSPNASKSGGLLKKDNAVSTAEKTIVSAISQTTLSAGEDDIKELRGIPPMEKSEGHIVSKGDNLDNKLGNGDSVENSSTQLNLEVTENNNGVAFSDDPKGSKDHGEGYSETTAHPLPEQPTEDVNVSAVNISENDATGEISHQAGKSEIEVSTPPPELDDMNQEPIHSRKKWNSDENSPKAAKGFRKLLLFGKKSRAIATA